MEKYKVFIILFMFLFVFELNKYIDQIHWIIGFILYIYEIN